MHISTIDIVVESISPSLHGELGEYTLRYTNHTLCAKLPIDESLLLKQGSKAVLVSDSDNPIFLQTPDKKWIYIGPKPMYAYYNHTDSSSTLSTPFKNAGYYMMTTGAMQILSLLVTAALMFVVSHPLLDHEAYLASAASVIIAALGLGRAKKGQDSCLSSYSLQHAISRHNKTVRLATLPCAILLSSTLLYCYQNSLSPDVILFSLLGTTFMSCFISAALVKLTYQQQKSLDIPGSYARLFWREVAIASVIKCTHSIRCSS